MKLLENLIPKKLRSLNKFTQDIQDEAVKIFASDPERSFVLRFDSLKLKANVEYGIDFKLKQLDYVISTLKDKYQVLVFKDRALVAKRVSLELINIDK